MNIDHAAPHGSGFAVTPTWYSTPLSSKRMSVVFVSGPM